MTKKEDHLYELESDLKPWLPRDEEIGKLLEGAATGAAELDQDMEAVREGLSLQEANTKAEIEQIAYPTQISSDESESLERFRSRAFVELQGLTRSGSPEEILELTSTVLGVSKNDLRLENAAGAKFTISSPLSAINARFGSVEETIDILLDATAASYGLSIYGVGTLNYITEADRSNGDFNPDEGYATLDADGNITSGGTYSGTYYYGNNS